MTINCLIFDFDGVIADTDKARFQILCNILEGYGVNLETKLFEKLIGYSTESFLKNNFSKLSEIDISEIIRKRHIEYFSDLAKYCIPFENMIEVINELSAIFKLAIVTTHTTENVKKQLRHLDIERCFEWVIGREFSEDENLKKTYKQIPSLIQFSPSTCIVIEDSKVGVQAAKETGFYCIRFNSNQQIFKREKADDIASNYRELKNKILGYTVG